MNCTLQVLDLLQRGGGEAEVTEQDLRFFAGRWVRQSWRS